MYIFDGKKSAGEKEEELKSRLEGLKKKGIVPKLETFLIGNDPASEMYVGIKVKAARRLGIVLHLNRLASIKADSLIQQIEVLNNDESVHGIMVQLPVPNELNESQSEILNTIAKGKDVDGLRDDPGFLPATVRGVMYAIREAQKQGFLSQNWSQIKVVVVGSEGVVGKPLSNELEKLGAQVIRYDKTLPVSQGSTLRSYVRDADLLISATGVPGLITRDMVRPRAVVIDVGAPKGDVADDVREVASFITPVPGGIGPMTVVCLMENVVEAAEYQCA